jgi:hypothetical protein
MGPVEFHLSIAVAPSAGDDKPCPCHQLASLGVAVQRSPSSVFLQLCLSKTMYLQLCQAVSRLQARSRLSAMMVRLTNRHFGIPPGQCQTNSIQGTLQQLSHPRAGTPKANLQSAERHVFLGFGRPTQRVPAISVTGKRGSTLSSVSFEWDLATVVHVLSCYNSP